MKVLIVEDNANDRRLLRYTFEHHGCSVIEASDGREGLELASAHRPDIIVSDALMPVMDGFQLLRALKSDPALRSIPFVFYSASYTGHSEEDLAVSLGAESFMLKPKEPEELWAEANKVLQSRQLKEEPGLGAGESEEQFLREYSHIVATQLEVKMSDLEEELARRKKAEAEVRTLNEELEQRVRERTAALVVKSRELEQSQQALVMNMEELKSKADQLKQANDALALENRQRTQAQEEISWLNDDLRRQRSALEATNKELESFSYSVSHDLRAPLRHICGFIKLLAEEHGSQLDETGRQYLERIGRCGAKMNDLIDALLMLSRVGRSEMVVSSVDLSSMARQIFTSLSQTAPDRSITLTVAEGVTVRADGNLMQILLDNLLGNAWKYTGKKEHGVIEFGRLEQDGKQVVFVRDNGVGFDMTYAGKLFGAFQRLHTDKEYEGTGIGLATVLRIVQRHGGRVWADAKPGEGATFYFTL